MSADIGCPILRLFRWISNKINIPDKLFYAGAGMLYVYTFSVIIVMPFYNIPYPVHTKR